MIKNIDSNAENNNYICCIILQLVKYIKSVNGSFNGIIKLIFN